MLPRLLEAVTSGRGRFDAITRGAGALLQRRPRPRTPGGARADGSPGADAESAVRRR